MSKMLTTLSMLVLLCKTSAAAELFTLTPTGSLTVLEGTLVMSNCSTTHEKILLQLSAGSRNMPNEIVSNIIRKDKNTFFVHISFVATPKFNNSMITCRAGGIVNCTEAINVTEVQNCTNGTTGIFTTKTVILLVKNGALSAVSNLTSTEVDHCTLHFTWTAPYTLQGVPINYYTINITRHSDGAVLRSDTTNTTEYLYSVSSLGETLEVVVAAVNGAGTGNTTAIIAHVLNRTLLPITLDYSNTTRLNNENWRYQFVVKNDSFCGDIELVIGKINDNGNVFTNSSNTTVITLENGMQRVLVTFSNLVEDRKYSASVYVQYLGGVVQRSRPVEISTFDVQNVILSSSVGGELCIEVVFVKGYESQLSTVKLECLTEARYCYNKTFVINGTSRCLSDLPSSDSCNITITDFDATGSIDVSPAIKKTEVSIAAAQPSTHDTTTLIPSNTVIATIATHSPTITPTGNELPYVLIGGLVCVGTTLLLLLCLATLVGYTAYTRCKSSGVGSNIGSHKNNF